MEVGICSNLEYIIVLKFNGDKIKFECFWIVFFNCVDKGFEFLEIKIFWLELCLVGKVVDILEGFKYFEIVYVIVKMRL